MKTTFTSMLVATAVSLVLTITVPRTATADCWIVGAACNTTYCDIQCDDSRDYIVFGTWSVAGTSYTGVCWYPFSGTWGQGSWTSGDRAGTTTDSADWRIKAGGGNDLVRLADRGGAEECGADGDIESGDTFMFWGEGDDDRLFLCDLDSISTAPASGDCFPASARADGRAGSDYVYGSVWDDELWGDSGNDTLRGFDLYDTLHGGADNDYLYGGSHCDDLYGDGETTYDYCDCSDNAGSTNEGWELEADHDCEYSDGKCQDCLLLFGDPPFGGVECPRATDPDDSSNSPAAGAGSSGDAGTSSGSPDGG